MTAIERRMKGLEHEIRRLTRSKERHERKLERMVAVCDKYKCNWNRDQFLANMDSMTQTQWVAYFHMFCEQMKVADLSLGLKNANQRLGKLMPHPDDLAQNIGM